MLTIILTSHMKPTLRDAIASVLDQTRGDFECVVMDSGQWHGQSDALSVEMAAIHDRALQDPRVVWVSTGEPPDLRTHLCPVGWATNEVIRRGLVRGEYVCTFYDDDRYEPTFVERMVGYLEATGESAVWCSQNRVRLVGGEEQPSGYIQAGHVLLPGMLDNRVDGGQVMFTRAALMSVGDPWLPEDPSDGTCRHSDGIFLEKLCAVVGSISPLDEMLVVHRFTSYSTYSPA
jgi:hypothetical protein